MKFFSKLKQAVFFLMFLFFTGVLTTGCMAGGSGSGDAAAPLFTLKDTQDRTVSLGDMLKQNKAVLINFWATWCPPCREEIPELIRLQSEYGKRGFTVLGVDVGESPTKVSSFINKMGINYPVALDRDQKVAAEYGLVGIPTSYLVSSEGKIIGEYHAATPELFNDVKNAVE